MTEPTTSALDALTGRRLPGGCDDCTADQTVQQHAPGRLPADRAPRPELPHLPSHDQKEPPVNAQTPQLVDARRAATLVVHFGRRDVEGVNAVIEEVNSDDDPNAATARLLFATLELYAGILPSLHTPRGLALLNAMVVDMARADLGAQP